MTTNNDKIKVLNDRDQSRSKLPIWYGSRDNFVHGVKELIANAADELRNHATEPGEVLVELAFDNKTIFVRDNGRGIPFYEETDGVPNYVLLFQTLFAGTKYDVTESVTTGTNGVGTTVLNYTSLLFEVTTWTKDSIHRLTFENGGIFKSIDKSKNTSEIKHGTQVKIKLDPEVYTATTFKPEIIQDIVKHFAIPAIGIEFTFGHIVNEDGLAQGVVFKYNSYKEYFEELVSNNSTSSIFTLGSVRFEETVKVFNEDGNLVETQENNLYDIQIATTPEVDQEAYLNMTYLSEGGSINSGVIDGIRLYINKYCREKKLFPKKVEAFSKEDVESSISFLAVVESNNVEFSNQTKLSTNKKHYNKNVKSYMTQLLDASQVEKPKEFKKMVDHLLEVQKHNNDNDKAKEKLKKKLSEKVTGLRNRVKKLIDSKEHGENSELFIAEGDSAKGSIVLARDAKFQAAYPLRGKVLNVEKSGIDLAMSNQVVLDLIRAVGAGITLGGKKSKDLGDFDLKKARFGKLIIATDADPDGSSIAALIITIIWQLMRPYLTEGRVYIAKTPLYEVKLANDEMMYFYSEKEKDDGLSKIEGKYILQRLKGLGEVDAEVMKQSAMDPKTRKLVQLKVESEEELEAMIADWMGSPVEARKDFISKHLPDYIDLGE